MTIRRKLMAALPAILLIGTGRSADTNSDILKNNGSLERLFKQTGVYNVSAAGKTPGFVNRKRRRLAGQRGAAIVDYRHSHAAEQQNQRSKPQQIRLRIEGRLQQDIIPVAGHDVPFDLCVGVSGQHTLTHQEPQIMRQIRIGIVDGLVLANEAAQFLPDGTCARFELGIGQHLVRPDRPRRSGPAGGNQSHASQTQRNAQTAFHLLNFSAKGIS